MITTNRDYIYLYAARGTDEFCVEQTMKALKKYLGNHSARLVPIYDVSYIKSRQWFSQVSTIVFPGGNAHQIRLALGEEASKIQDFVLKNKGSFLGLCSGAYMAGPFTYNVGKPNEFKTDGYLPLIKATHLFGPAYPLNTEPTTATARAVSVKFTGLNGPCYVYWNGGGYYKHTNPLNQTPLAWYQEESNAIAALADYTLGGRVVTCNVHPEMQMSPEEIEKYCPHLENKEKYLQDQPKQQTMFEELCKIAGISNSES